MLVLRRFIFDEDGVAVLDFAIVGSVFIMALLGLMDISRGFYLSNKLDYAADRISRQLMIDPDLTAASIDLPTALDAFNESDLTIEIIPQMVGGLEYRQLTLSYPMSILTAFIHEDLLRLRVERLVYAPS